MSADGQQRRIPTREIIPGDLILIEEGDPLAGRL
jgi:magnesium-transporting ATPase (P-type)